MAEGRSADRTLVTLSGKTRWRPVWRAAARAGVRAGAENSPRAGQCHWCCCCRCCLTTSRFVRMRSVPCALGSKVYRGWKARRKWWPSGLADLGLEGACALPVAAAARPPSGAGLCGGFGGQRKGALQAWVSVAPTCLAAHTLPRTRARGGRSNARWWRHGPEPGAADARRACRCGVGTVERSGARWPRVTSGTVRRP